jgi:hypothetical protein
MEWKDRSPKDMSDESSSCTASCGAGGGGKEMAVSSSRDLERVLLVFRSRIAVASGLGLKVDRSLLCSLVILALGGPGSGCGAGICGGGGEGGGSCGSGWAGCGAVPHGPKIQNISPVLWERSRKASSCV